MMPSSEEGLQNLRRPAAQKPPVNGSLGAGSLREAVRRIDASAGGPEAATKCKDVLSKLLGNLHANPGNEKYRRVRKTNKLLAAAVFAVDGGEAFLVALGFAPAGDEFLEIAAAETVHLLLVGRGIELLQPAPAPVPARADQQQLLAGTADVGPKKSPLPPSSSSPDKEDAEPVTAAEAEPPTEPSGASPLSQTAAVNPEQSRQEPAAAADLGGADELFRYVWAPTASPLSRSSSAPNPTPSPRAAAAGSVAITPRSAATAAAPSGVECCICMDDFDLLVATSGIHCTSARRHFTCADCFKASIGAACEEGGRFASLLHTSIHPAPEPEPEGEAADGDAGPPPRNDVHLSCHCGVVICDAPKLASSASYSLESLGKGALFEGVVAGAVRFSDQVSIRSKVIQHMSCQNCSAKLGWRYVSGGNPRDGQNGKYALASDNNLVVTLAPAAEEVPDSEPEAEGFDDPAAEEPEPEPPQLEPVAEPDSHSGAGDYPCPLFPQDCSCGKLADGEIYRVIHSDPAALHKFQVTRDRLAGDRAVVTLRAEEAAQQREAERRGQSVLARAKHLVEVALLHGAMMPCPGCGNAGEKDDACMHMVMQLPLCLRFDSHSDVSCVVEKIIWRRL